MSDNLVIFIPCDPHATASAAALESARRAVEHAFPAAHEVTAQAAAHPQFIDAGTSFERVSCPACDAALDDWWPGAMDSASADNFNDLSVVTPCCSTKTTLNDLSYHWPQGFARLSIHAQNPGVSDVAPEVRDAVARCLGVATRIVWCHH